MVSVTHCVGPCPWDIGSVSSATTLLLSQVNCMREMRGTRREMVGLQHEVHTQQFLALLTTSADPDLRVIFGKPAFLPRSAQSPATFWLTDVSMEATLEPTIYISRITCTCLPLATGFGAER